jgi:2,4-dienoyl-CoA reductase-like NADH-dependent reductase (Old Yellow Enzyme family)
MTTYTRLFTPGKIGKLEIKNRIFQAPMGTFYNDAEGVPSDETIDYFVERPTIALGFSLSFLRVRGEKIHKERFQWSITMGFWRQRTVDGKEIQDTSGL